MRSWWPTQCTGVLWEEGRLAADSLRRKGHEVTQQTWCHISTSQGTPRVAGRPWDIGVASERRVPPTSSSLQGAEHFLLLDLTGLLVIAPRFPGEIQRWRGRKDTPARLRVEVSSLAPVMSGRETVLRDPCLSTTWSSHSCRTHSSYNQEEMGDVRFHFPSAVHFSTGIFQTLSSQFSQETTRNSQGPFSEETAKEAAVWSDRRARGAHCWPVTRFRSPQ